MLGSLPFDQVLVRSIEILYGLFWLWSGLNSIFHWQAVPHVSDKMDRFVNACMDTGFIMPTVKLVEILVGILFIFSLTIAGLLFISPIVFGVIGLHIVYNKKPIPMILIVMGPYAILALSERFFFIDALSR